MALGTVVLAIVVVPNIWIRVVLLWMALAFLIVAVAYATGRPQLLMKRSDGSQPIRAWILFWPYFLLTHFSFWLFRITHMHSVSFAEVLPGLWFSRRLTASEAIQSGIGWTNVLDLAAEFPRAGVDAEMYFSLDGDFPTDSQLHDATEWISQRLEHGPVLIHCALGHGRTGCVVLAWLLVNGHAQDLNSGIEKLRALRSGFGVSKKQAASITRFIATRRE
jgi:protein-tyrosine phosphatase